MFRPIGLGRWDSFVGSDFSGRVLYRRRIVVPADWKFSSLQIALGRIDYAARARIDGREVAVSPHQSISVPHLGNKRVFLSRSEVANTLANLLTSSTIQDKWRKKSGPGWPGPYHQRAFEFEKDSRSGGLFGPVQLISVKYNDGRSRLLIVDNRFMSYCAPRPIRSHFRFGLNGRRRSCTGQIGSRSR